ncbi:imidazole glycerol phosphate synthase subunit HisH [Vibrio scophthalmi]|uniref:imidazole glycerol phosphate synthase subunit HisH n=1 Tax=Vibrio scophthalmi TaxID=45658 RepID=UPI003AAE9166
MISIINYGMGNIGSVVNMIKKIGGKYEVVSTPEQVLKAEKLLLPGVGSFDAGVKLLRSSGLEFAIKASVSKGTPLLGICLGMQLLLDSSEEGNQKGLGLISGTVKKFDGSKYNLKVPHMGWNIINPTKDSFLFDVVDNNHSLERFYFVHSYYVECDDFCDISGYTTYGNKFVSAIEREKVMGVQFHPEKSHKFGMKLIKRFWEL